VKFIVGLALGYFLAAPIKKDSKVDQVTSKVAQNVGHKIGEIFVSFRDKAFG